MMKRWKRTLAVLLALTVLTVCAPLGVFANESMTQNGDIVLVMDDTGSMRWNDPNFVASAAVSQLAVKTPKNGSNVGVVTFSTQVMATLPMMEMNTDTVNRLEQFAHSGITRSGDYTDLAVGLKEAVRMLTAMEDSDNVQAIIAVTDGANDYGSGRTEAMSARDLAEVEQIAQEQGITIHLIGINQDASTVKAYLQGIAGVTGGSAAFVSDADGMTKEISHIYETLGILQGGGTSTEHVGANGLDKPLTVPENTFEAVVTITHPSPIRVTITGPDGSMMDPSDPDDNLYITAYTTQTAFKIWEPEAGSYSIRIENLDVTEQDVEISTYLNSEFQVEVSCPTTACAGDTVTVDAALTRGGSRYTNADLQHLTGEVTLTNGSDTKTVPMRLDGDVFTADLPLTAEGDWQLTATLRGSKTFRRSNDTAVIIQVGAAAQPAPFPWWIPAAVLGVVAAAVLLVLKHNQKAQLRMLPRGNIAVQLVNRSSVCWTVPITPRAVFAKGAARRKGVTLLQILKDHNRKTVSPVPMTAADEELYGKVLVKPDFLGDKVRFEWSCAGKDGTENRATLLQRMVTLPLDRQNGIALRLQWR